jgi:cytidine deaminase
MKSREAIVQSNYRVYEGINNLSEEDQALLLKARTVSANAYAPYSGFRVGAAAIMAGGSIVTGSNQENASYPIGICAERVLLAAVSSIAPSESISVMAITYQSDEVDSSKPVAPCGMCRQSLVEFENRYSKPMRLLLSGSEGEIFEFDSVSELLPFSFKAENLGK